MKLPKFKPGDEVECSKRPGGGRARGIVKSVDISFEYRVHFPSVGASGNFNEDELKKVRRPKGH